MTTSRPLAGSAGGGVGRGSLTRLDFFIFPADLSSFFSPAEKPVRAFSSTLAWYRLVGNPSMIQPVSSGIHLQAQQVNLSTILFPNVAINYTVNQLLDILKYDL